ncbi:MAG: hypothetical protein JW722_05390 [Demequinaceae bacterium]|nr:hypothetical protein [Demequinaceae bacterium]
MSEFIEWRALADVVVVGLIVGAGLPALFALGVRALAGPGSRTEVEGRRPSRIAGAVACFTIVGSAVISAIVAIGNGGH